MLIRSSTSCQIGGPKPLPHGWQLDPGKQVAWTIAIRRAKRDARYQQARRLREQGLAIKEIAYQLGVSERTVQHWFERGVALTRNTPAAFSALPTAPCHDRKSQARYAPVRPDQAV
ncbi:helix-turn-helix domain-containing protein [Ktedonobacter sp. SOSP1-52]|uniref:helix-turn-helix domain-containing protein n=1 Tax=Ktedonobacter sp. SOSP1-52 TaxID=2778366 RepID=UPI001F1C3C66|nr:helix-turn-helix domain-containing protein [Ktedonobacter sp. SOSP1-52]